MGPRSGGESGRSPGQSRARWRPGQDGDPRVRREPVTVLSLDCGLRIPVWGREKVQSPHRVGVGGKESGREGGRGAGGPRGECGWCGPCVRGPCAELHVRGPDVRWGCLLSSGQPGPTDRGNQEARRVLECQSPRGCAGSTCTQDGACGPGDQTLRPLPPGRPHTHRNLVPNNREAAGCGPCSCGMSLSGPGRPPPRSCPGACTGHTSVRGQPSGHSTGGARRRISGSPSACLPLWEEDITVLSPRGSKLRFRDAW